MSDSLNEPETQARACALLDAGKTSGQALVEFAYFGIFAATLFIGAGLILREEWHFSRCAYLSFEKTHDSLTHSQEPDFRLHFSPSFNLQAFPTHIVGTQQCGSHRETVSLPLLDPAKWK